MAPADVEITTIHKLLTAAADARRHAINCGCNPAKANARIDRLLDVLLEVHARPTR